MPSLNVYATSLFSSLINVTVPVILWTKWVQISFCVDVHKIVFIKFFIFEKWHCIIFCKRRNNLSSKRQLTVCYSFRSYVCDKIITQFPRTFDICCDVEKFSSSKTLMSIVLTYSTHIALQHILNIIDFNSNNIFAARCVSCQLCNSQLTISLTCL